MCGPRTLRTEAGEPLQVLCQLSLSYIARPCLKTSTHKHTFKNEQYYISDLISVTFGVDLPDEVEADFLKVFVQKNSCFFPYYRF